MKLAGGMDRVAGMGKQRVMERLSEGERQGQGYGWAM